MLKPIFNRTAVLSGCLFLVATIGLANSIARAASNNGATKFERDLESLFGAAIATKHGEMTLRQQKDSSGIVRKQILVGPAFSEIQMDQNADGTVDFWEVTRGEKTVAASNPSRGRFLRMNVTERSKEGTFEAFYVLDLDGRRYNLLRTKFDRADRKMFSESVPESFSASDIPEAPVIPASSTATSSTERFDLEDQSWREYQSKLWGPDLLCVSDDSSTGRLASLQREWWKILKRDADGRVDRLTQKLKDSKMFDSSCRKAGREKDFDKIAKSLSELMMTSSKGEASADTQSRGRYLRCLENSGLGITAARIEQNFLSGMNDPYRAENPIRCDFKPGAAGQANPGYANHTAKQIVLHMCLPDEGKAKTIDGSAQNYKNVLLHELIHIAGVQSEAMTHAAQACCGEPTDNRVSACGKLDKLIAEERRFTELEAFLARDAEMAPLLSELNAKFDANGTADLYRKFLLGLDNYKRGAPPKGVFENGIISNEEFSKCVKTSSETQCREQWVRHLESYADEFFKKDCKKIVIGASKSQCKNVSADFKSRLANTIARSMIQLSSDRDPADPQICKTETPSSFFGGRTVQLLWKFVSPAIAVEEVPCEDGVVAPPAPPIVRPPPSTVAGEVPPVAPIGSTPSLNPGMKSPTISVPGDSDSGGVVSRPGGDSSVVSQPPVPSRPIGVPDRSPLPVTRVTSPSSGRTVAERSYQRATDVAGLTTRGLKDLRDSIVPRAVAADRSGSKSARLDGEESFIAFRPTKSESKALKIDNPFAASRATASLVLPKGGSSLLSKSASPASDIGVGSVAPMATNVGGQSGGGSLPSPKATSTSFGGKTAGDNLVSGSKTTTKDGSAVDPNAQPTAPGGKSATSREPAQAAALLEGLFTRRYKLIEGRLNDLRLQQLLIDRGIKIIGADGRMIGAKKTVNTCYKYVGQEFPLKTPCEN
ncbi:MAG: hypothetical protein U1E10_15065 [Bdellovibrionales bacterium]|nr:hypothetical protein [Bdellovibrionales bacterium]